MKEDNFLNFTTRIDEFTKQPDKFLSLQEAQAEQIKRLTEDLYNFSKNNEQKNLTLDTLPRLVVENVDEEQIWQQIELQNNSICNNLMGDIAHLLAKNDLTFFLKTENKVKKLNNNENVEKSKKTSNEISRNELSSEVSEPQFKIKAKKGKSSIVDDKFFKLHEMEEFLEKLEKGEDDNDDNNEDIDYFQDSDSSSDEEQLHYNDFFDQPDDDDGEVVKENKINKVKLDVNDENSDEGGDDDHDNEEQQQKEDEKEGKKKYNKRVKFDVSEEEDEDEEDENEELDDSSEDVDDEEEEEEEEEEVQNELKENDSEDEDHVTNQPSTFEARQERLKSRIKALESAALKEKPWQLKGEVTANSRPQNSLLEEYVEFDVATRPAPILTEKSTLKLEDIIMQRIKDKAWDDVVRKIKPTEGDLEYKKKLVLDQEKSKLSLAQIYEQEYLNQLDQKKESVVDKPEVEAPEHREIRIMMNKLFAKLDALSNFHFTPKQVKEEVKIISNIPAVNMEEVAPVATSDAALLAPEEVKPKSKGELIGKSERTATDKKRERRKKKIKQQLKFKQIALKEREKLKKDSPEGHNKNGSQKLLQKITKNRNVIQLDEDKGGKYVKSSKAFFSKLQEDTSSPVKKGLNLKKLKLGKKHSSKNR